MKKENEIKEDEESDKIDWHPGFVNAIKLEFFENEKDLIYESEKNLNQQPLRIDLLVVKKSADVKIKNEIGENFLGHNIIEFKSEDDKLNIDTVFKVLGYACLYKSYGDKIDSIKTSDITLTLMRKLKPTRLFKLLIDSGKKIEQKHNGIYNVVGFEFPIQIISTKELSPENHVWVGSLQSQLERQKLENVLEATNNLQTKAEKMYAESVMSVVSQLNTKNLKTIKKELNMGMTLRQIMQPEIDEAVNEAVEKTIKNSLIQSVKNLMETLSFSIEQAFNALKVSEEDRKMILPLIS